MKVALDLDKVHCVLCDQDAAVKAVIVDKDDVPVSLEVLFNAFLRNPASFHTQFHPVRFPIGRSLGEKALPGITAKNMVLCIMHGEIRIVINLCQYHLREVRPPLRSSDLWLPFNCNIFFS